MEIPTVQDRLEDDFDRGRKAVNCISDVFTAEIKDDVGDKGRTVDGEA